MWFMGLSNAERQARWRAKHEALVRSDPRAVENALLQAVERFERGQLPSEERVALADWLADVAMVHLRRSQEFARLAREVRTGEG
jgi:hypothetical protein